MPYLNLDPNYFEHPKTRRLVGLLGPMSDVLPLRLWAYCAKIHPIDGRLKGYEAGEVEAIIGWSGAPKAAIAAMVKVGFILEAKDGFSCVDWRQHEGHMAAFSRRGKVAAKARWAKYAASMPKAMQKAKLSNAPTVPSLPTVPTLPTKPTEPTVVKSPAQRPVDLSIEGSDLRMPFGEFKGVHVSNLEPSYCKWLLTEFKGKKSIGPELRKALQEVVDRKAEEIAR